MATKIKMEHIQSDIDLQVDNPSKNAANLIEWNLDMKVTVSNVKNSKMFQRSRTIVFFLLAIIFTVILSHLKKEVHALQIQVQSVNVNLLLLMAKYDKLNRNLNQAWIRRSERFVENKNLKKLLEDVSSISKVIEILDGIRKTGNEGSYVYNSIIPYLNPGRNFKEKHASVGDVYSRNSTNNSVIPKILTNLRDNEDKLNTNLRIERAVPTLQEQNATENEMQLNRDKMNYDYYDDDDLGIWKEPRSGRSRRDEGRGPLVATFVGAVPEQHITDTVYIGPWVKSTKNDSQYSLNKFHLVENKKSIEVTLTGLYMISAQIFYFGEPTNYSYWILLSSEGKSKTQKLVKCSTASSSSATEVSCYTSVITSLQKGDRVHIQQQERDRLINMREGHSYIQLVLLSNTSRKRRLR
ncbi:unnamed protein product [Xylocopa violacea]|uniref:THD domain-containing protein n=1 Tax=Xylocopa violacea TaxID=135666 RepID=A0ABP1NQQ1_XYLVO